MTQTLQQLTYTVPDMSCGHCRAAITAGVEKVPGVASVEVDLEAKLVTVVGAGVEDGRTPSRGSA